MLPPKSAFVTPVLSTAAPIVEAQPRRPGGGGGGGPVIEYVRGPMRIAAAPVASANPNDAGVARRRGKKQRRWDRGPGGGGGGGYRNDGPRRFDQQRPFDPNRAGDQRGPQQGGRPFQAEGGGNGAPGEPGERRRRRRRRRRRGNGMPVQGGPMQLGGGAPGDALPDNGEPVSFFQPTGQQQGPMLGPDGQPIRKRRRRRRRGRGGRNRDWRMQGGGGEGGGGAPPSEGGGDGGGGGGGGAITDGGAAE